MARYADTNGYQVDPEREMWPWRDWVIDAFNRNLPFDRFTIEQLAGDLLPNATARAEDRHRLQPQPPINSEGGAIAEEFQAENVVDRVSTTATVLLGPHPGLRAVPRSQVRPDLAEGVLPALRLLQSRADEMGNGGPRDGRGNHKPACACPSRHWRRRSLL